MEYSGSIEHTEAVQLSIFQKVKRNKCIRVWNWFKGEYTTDQCQFKESAQLVNTKPWSDKFEFNFPIPIYNPSSDFFDPENYIQWMSPTC